MCFSWVLCVCVCVCVCVEGGGGYTTCRCAPYRAQKSKFPKLIFWDMVTTHNDHPCDVKHVLGSIYVFFPLFGYWVRRGGG